MADRISLRVLLVEDDVADARMFGRHAAASAAYSIEIDLAGDAEATRRRLSEREYDLVFLDNRLGGETLGHRSHRRRQRADGGRDDEGRRNRLSR